MEAPGPLWRRGKSEIDAEVNANKKPQLNSLRISSLRPQDPFLFTH